MVEQMNLKNPNTAQLEEDKSDIMVIDDTSANLIMLKNILEAEGYSVRTFAEGQSALLAAAQDSPDLVLLDIRMPDMDGFEVCKRFKRIEDLANIPIIFISGLSEIREKVSAFQVGGVDYITKPFQVEEVLARVTTHLKINKLQNEIKRDNEHLQDLVQEQFKDIISSKEEISQAQLAIILAISKITEARDDDTGKHIERTRDYCNVLARELQLHDDCKKQINDAFISNLYHACPLHDIGKVAIPDSILQKPGKLTADEFEIMKTHTIKGATNLDQVLMQYPNNEFIMMGTIIARWHHEKWDGSGYPDGLEKDDIPLPAQIMAIADVYDALRSRRCYKKALSHEESKEIILEGKGNHFAPMLVDAFLKVEKEFIAISERADS